MRNSKAVEYRFPRTPHFPGSVVVDDDRSMDANELSSLCERCSIHVQEKIDGANCSLFFESDTQPVCQKRSGRIGHREKEQYNWFRNWVFENSGPLWEVLGTHWVAFGELLWSTHALCYDALPDFVIFFDLLDRTTNEFECGDSVRDVFGDRYAVLPTLWSGRLTWPFDVESAFGRFLVRSLYCSSPPEGLYFRFESDGRLIGRAKYRRPGFLPGREGKPQRNRLLRESQRRIGRGNNLD